MENKLKIDTQIGNAMVQAEQLEQFYVQDKPFYQVVGNEEKIFSAAYKQRLPVLLKGPTGCGKTRFVEAQAYNLQVPLFTVSCHEDLTANDLVGRLILKGGETEFIKGPLALAAEYGGIAYLDEVVEARKDTIVAIHSLTDHRRQLYIEKLQQQVDAHPNFLLVCSYNPGYQSIVKNLKPSTKQRFVSIPFDYPSSVMETSIVKQVAGINQEDAARLVRLGEKVRNLKDQGLEEGASTRLLIYTGLLMNAGIGVKDAVRHAIIEPVADDDDMRRSLEGVLDAIYGV
jgi:nitric oxide reductase NorQ protein